MAQLLTPSFKPAYSSNRNVRKNTEALVTINEKCTTPNYVKLRISTREWHVMQEIEMWCYETGCGKRVNQNSFAFKDEGALMMFMMKWAPDTSNMRETSG